MAIDNRFIIHDYFTICYDVLQYLQWELSYLKVNSKKLSKTERAYSFYTVIIRTKFKTDDDHIKRYGNIVRLFTFRSWYELMLHKDEIVAICMLYECEAYIDFGRRSYASAKEQLLKDIISTKIDEDNGGLHYLWNIEGQIISSTLKTKYIRDDRTDMVFIQKGKDLSEEEYQARIEIFYEFLRQYNGEVFFEIKETSGCYILVRGINNRSMYSVLDFLKTSDKCWMPLYTFRYIKVAERDSYGPLLGKVEDNIKNVYVNPSIFIDSEFNKRGKKLRGNNFLWYRNQTDGIEIPQHLQKEEEFLNRPKGFYENYTKYNDERSFKIGYGANHKSTYHRTLKERAVIPVALDARNRDRDEKGRLLPYKDRSQIPKTVEDVQLRTKLKEEGKL